MADRLQELLQQRALIKEHLAWIEGEIAAASGRTTEPRQNFLASPAPTALTAPTVRPPAPIAIARAATPAIAVPPLRDDHDALIAQLAAEEKTPPLPTKKGCWIFFCIVLAVLAAAAWGSLRYFYRE